MKYVISIDTEEDNWGKYSTWDNPVKNIQRLVPLQQLFDRYGARPSYLISYPVATNPTSVAILKKLLDEGKCEIGMHCHPWNTPPFEEEISAFNSMLSNLPGSLVLKKLRTLHEAIQENLGVTPVSFRAGRWGFSTTVAQALCQLGYRVDTSVSPFVDWHNYHGPDFSDFQLFPYRFDPDDIKTPREQGALLELPATVGFLQNNFERCQRWTRYLENDFGKMFKMKGILSRLRLLNKVWLSPELAEASDMIQLARRMDVMGHPCLNMSFHSTTLMAGLSPFVKVKSDEVRFMRRIEEFLTHAATAGWQSVFLSDMEESSEPVS